MSRRTTGMGRIFKRRSRVTRAELSTWWIAYYVDGRERRESSHSTEYGVAKRLLRDRLHSLSEGTYTGPERERLTVGELLDGVIAYYELQNRRSLPSVRGHVKVWKAELGVVAQHVVHPGPPGAKGSYPYESIPTGGHPSAPAS